MLHPDKASVAAPQRRIFWQIVLIVWSLLALLQSIIKTSNDPNSIFLRLTSKETVYNTKPATGSHASRHELRFANSW
jgi:hypothetical protein